MLFRLQTTKSFFAGSALLTLFFVRITQAQGIDAGARQQAELGASDGRSSDYFGGAVSLWGTRALIGGGLSSPIDQGAAYVFVFDGTGWRQEAKLTPSDGKPFDLFGGSVSLLGERALIGGGLADRNKGAAYTFVFDGTNWNEEAKIVPSNLRNSDDFGSSVSLSGNRALIGASEASSTGAPGKAYVFVFDGTNWIQEAELVPDHQTNVDFGISVSLSGNRALIGADQSPTDNGKAYVFVFDGTTWKQEAELTVPDGQPNDRFGRSVSLSGNRALIGADQLQANPPAPGKAYIFAFDGVSWNQEAVLTSSDAQSTDNFGISVSLAGKHALVGASQLDANGGLGGAGAAYLFVFDGTSWIQKSKLIAADGQPPDAFGSAVFLWKNRALVGAERADDATGLAYIFTP